MGLIEANPVRSLEKPKAGRRDHVITAEQFETILVLVKDEEFRDLLTVCWETGCRPQEVLSVEARHVDLEGGCWVFPVDESKGKKHQRIVYLTDTALEITRRLMAAHPAGRCSEHRRAAVVGIRAELPFRPAAAGPRPEEARGAGADAAEAQAADQAPAERPEVRQAHHEAVLERRRQIAALASGMSPDTPSTPSGIRGARTPSSAGVDAVTVAVLMGHRDTTMICRVYSHLMQRRDHLREAVRKAAGA